MMISQHTERRLREIAKQYKKFSDNMWRVEGYGQNMTSVVIKKRPKVAKLYIGDSLQLERQYTDHFSLYIAMADMMEALPECVDIPVKE